MKRFNLQAKFLVVTTLLLIGIFGAISYILIRNNVITLRTNLRRESQAFAALATKPIGDTFVIYQDSGRIKIAQQIEKFTDLDSTITNVQIVDSTGMVLFGQQESNLSNVSSAQASSFEPVYQDDATGNLQEIIYPYFEDSGAHRYSIVYTVSSETINQNIQSVRLSILRFSVIALIVSALLTYLLINRLFLRPIQQVSQQALIISAGNLASGIGLKRRDEIGDLALAVNKMATTLKNDITKLQEVDALKSEFMVIASHNLRTPLSVINGYVEMLQSMPLPSETKRQIAVINAQSKQLGAFTEDMLTISQLETGAKNFITKEPVQLIEFLTQIANDFSVLANTKKVDFVDRFPQSELTVKLHHISFRTALWNILDNALKFTPSGGKISFEARVDQQRLLITITDSGAGIKQSELPKLFTKFHRGTDALRYDYEGTGLGLYATKLIIEQHHGTINIDSAEGRGTIVTITVPLS